jgi:hypothetical protein
MMGYTPRERQCWQYQRGCRKNATHTVRVGDHAYAHCDDHTPATKESK